MGLQLLEPTDFFSDTLSFEYVMKVLAVLQEEKEIIEKTGFKKKNEQLL